MGSLDEVVLMPALAPSATASRRPTFRFKAAEVNEDGTFAGYGSVFGVVDSYGDIVLPGAFQTSLDRHRADGTRPKGLWQHDSNHPILSWQELREDDHGLYCKGSLILDVEKARETHALMKAGELDGLSIGYEVTAISYARPDEIEGKFGITLDPMPTNAGGQFRIIEAVDLWEISVVTFPACAPARIDTVKQTAPPVRDLSKLAAALERRGRLLTRLP